MPKDDELPRSALPCLIVRPQAVTYSAISAITLLYGEFSRLIYQFSQPPRVKRTITTVGYARVSSTGQDLAVQLEKLEKAGCNKVFKEKRSGVDTGRPELKRNSGLLLHRCRDLTICRWCLEYLREGDTLLVSKIDAWRAQPQTSPHLRARR